MRPIPSEEAEQRFGVTSKHQEMPNKEVRFRLLTNDGSAYIRTVAGDEGAWQDSHFHIGVRETYIVQEAWMGFAELVNDQVALRVFMPDEIVTSQPGVIHNVYLPSKAVIHTVKHGRSEGRDWHPAPQFDEMTKNLTSSEVLARAKNR